MVPCSPHSSTVLPDTRPAVGVPPAVPLTVRAEVAGEETRSSAGMTLLTVRTTDVRYFIPVLTKVLSRAERAETGKSLPFAQLIGQQESLFLRNLKC